MSPQSEEEKGVIKERALPGILSIQHGDLFMRDLRLDENLKPLEKRVPHLYAPGGFLDDSWWHRTYWIYGTRILSGYGGWPKVGNVVPAGRLLAFDGGEQIYGYGRMSYRAGAGHVHPEAAEDYKLFAEVREPKPEPSRGSRGNKKRNRPARGREIVWSKSPGFVARSMVLTRDAILVAGGQSLIESAENHGAGTFCVFSRGEGQKRAECELAAPPMLDGMAFTASGVFVCGIDGSVTCLRDEESGS
jgi:hypothetical protein